MGRVCKGNYEVKVTILKEEEFFDFQNTSVKEWSEFPEAEAVAEILYSTGTTGKAKGIVIIHQELALSPYLSVAENVFLGNEQTSVRGVINWTETRKKAHEMLEKVGLGDEDVNVPVGSLGVGKQQLIEIAKAMAKKVELLILPLLNLAIA